MKHLQLGLSTLHAPLAAVGCMRIADLSENELDRLVRGAIDQGLNFFDHADIYGGGECERSFGRLLARDESLRRKLLIQSKCGIRKGYFDFSREHILNSVDGSLQRLGTDHLDVLLLHRPDTLMEPEEVAEAFTLLFRSGKVRHFGVSNQNPGQLALLQKYIRLPLCVDQLQFGPAHTSIIDSGLNVNIKNDLGLGRDGGILEYCRLHEITIQAWSPFLFGFFEGVFLGHERYAALTEVLTRIGERYHLSPGAAAVAWIIRHPARIQPVLGTTRLERLQEYAAALEVEMTREEWYEIYRAAGNPLP